ncbi:hypothetical protein [Nocardioides sp.]|uniref:hypothetical protein n=1 Tax=Nocardioides sp. TaxID=35761 RepID=UPI0027362A22|nr:hypothetical protein [Nocardioides sp.]MDP3890772.1 hypothetical protein [Nocardioides sp.]
MESRDALVRAAAVIGVSFETDLLAEVVGLGPAEVLDRLAASDQVLFLDVSSGRFPDEDAHGELYASLRPSERARLHQQVAGVLIGWSREGRDVDPVEVARHLAAGGGDSRAAGFFLSAVGRAMDAREYGEAERLCDQAATALRAVPDADPLRAEIAIALGTARLAGGSLRSAQEAFKAAVVPARRSSRADLVARAALGLGAGASGFEVPLVDRTQLDLLEEALVGLPDSELSLRAQVLARLSVAASLVEHVDRRTTYVTEAVALARAAGDDTALGGALAAQCDVLAGPEHTDLRLRLADEIVELARAAGARESELLGRRHRLLALAEAGDLAGVDAEIRDFGALSAALGQPLHAWYVPLWRGMRALMCGRVEECRAFIDDAARIGSGIGSRNAELLTLTLRWCLLSETCDRVGLSAFAEEVGIADEPAVWAGVALGLIAAETGHHSEARTRLDSIAPRLASAPRDSEWLPMLTQIAELIGHLGDHPVAGWAYEALLPFTDRFVVEGIGAADRGSVHRPLGLLAAALGNTGRAAEHFAAAADLHREIGAPLLVARTHRDWGVSLGDRRALEQAAADYAQLGLSARLEEVRTRLGLDPAPGSREGSCFVLEGDTWMLTFQGRTVRLRDAKGMRDLARLLAAPGQPVPAVELASTGTRAVRRTAPEDQLHREGDLGEVLDATARAAYRNRLSQLDTEISEAEEYGDDERGARAKAERDLLVDQLSAAYGLGGRPRRAGDPAERARTAVTARIRFTIRRIEQAHPELGRHLRLSVRTGTLCTYEPDSPTAWTLD